MYVADTTHHTLPVPNNESEKLGRRIRCRLSSNADLQPTEHRTNQSGQ